MMRDLYMPATIAERLAVCSWSLQPESPAALIAALDQIGIKRIQLALNPLRDGGPWADAKSQLADAGVLKLSALRQRTGVERAGPILQANHYGWFERASRGHYDLSLKGRREIDEWPELPALDPPRES